VERCRFSVGRHSGECEWDLLGPPLSDSLAGRGIPHGDTQLGLLSAGPARRAPEPAKVRESRAQLLPCAGESGFDRPDGTRLVVGTEAGAVTILDARPWDLATRRELRSWFILKERERAAHRHASALRWVEALRHLDPLVESAPAETRLRLFRAASSCALDQWDRALADYAAASRSGLAWIDVTRLEGEPSEYACLLLRGGDREGYTAFCRTALKRLGTQVNPEVGSALARLCALSDRPVDDPKQLIEWAERPAKAGKTGAAYLHTEGLVHYRAGHFETALERFKMAAAAWGNAQVVNWFGLALTHKALGRTGDAKQWYEKAVAWMDGQRAPGGLLPQYWLEAELLRREFERSGGAGKE
jgi:tetratricopeptide (TPR) repeat protein